VLLEEARNINQIPQLDMISNASLEPCAISAADAETRLLLSTDDNGRILFQRGTTGKSPLSPGIVLLG